MEIVLVGSSKEALAALQENTFDCMLLNLAPTERTGYDSLGKMAAGEAISFPRVIVHIGRMLVRRGAAPAPLCATADRKKCIEADANEHTAKPIDVDTLVPLVKVWLPKQG